MKTGELISPRRLANGDLTQSAKIAREIVHRCVQTFVPEDREAAVDRALFQFYSKMKEDAKQELKLYQLRKVNAKT